MDTLTPQMRQEAARIAIETLTYLGREDLLPALFIEWKSSFTARMGDALYIWSDTNGRDYPAHASILLKFPKYRRVLSLNGSSVSVVRVRLSAALWPRASKEKRLETVIHEVSHLVAAHEAMLSGKTSIQSHGLEWKSVMLRAGMPTRRCHDVNTSGLGQNTIPCTCGCGDNFMTHLKAGRILSNQATYTCRKCRKKILVDMKRITGPQVQECIRTAERRQRKKKTASMFRVIGGLS